MKTNIMFLLSLRTYLLFAILLFAGLDAAAQTSFKAIYDGGKSYDVAAAVTAGRNGNLLVTGLTNRDQTGREIFVMRINKKGVVMWAKNFPISPQGIPADIIETGGGDIVVLGSNGVSRSDIFVIRLSATGAFLWSKSYGTPVTTPFLIGKSIVQTQDAGFVITGSYQAASTINKTILFRVNDKGEHLWSKEYGLEEADTYGSTVRELASGELVVAGQGMRPDSSFFAFMLLTDVQGKAHWMRSYTTAISLTGLGLQVKTDQLLMSGQIGEEAYLMQTDLTGQLTWARQYGLPGSQLDCTLGLTGDGQYLIQGRSTGEQPGLFMLQINQLGYPAWSQVYLGDHFALPANYVTGHSNATAVQLKEGGYGIVGGIFSTDGDPANALVLRTDAAGSAPCNQISQMPKVADITLQNNALEPIVHNLPLLPNGYVPPTLFYNYSYKVDCN